MIRLTFCFSPNKLNINSTMAILIHLVGLLKLGRKVLPGKTGSRYATSCTALSQAN